MVTFLATLVATVGSGLALRWAPELLPALENSGQFLLALGSTILFVVLGAGVFLAVYGKARLLPPKTKRPK